jgi:hypothetical protein
MAKSLNKSWFNVSIGEFQKLNIVLKEKKEGLNALSCITGLTESELENLPISKLDKLIHEYDFLNEDCPKKLVKKWEDYKVFNFNDKGGAGRIIDFMAAIEMGDYIENLHTICATIIYKDVEEDFQTKVDYLKHNLPIPIALGISDFFFQNFALDNKIILNYLRSKIPKPSKQKKQKSRKVDSKRFSNGIFG